MMFLPLSNISSDSTGSHLHLLQGCRPAEEPSCHGAHARDFGPLGRLAGYALNPCQGVGKKYSNKPNLQTEHQAEALALLDQLLQGTF